MNNEREKERTGERELDEGNDEARERPLSPRSDVKTKIIEKKKDDEHSSRKSSTGSDDKEKKRRKEKSKNDEHTPWKTTVDGNDKERSKNIEMREEDDHSVVDINDIERTTRKEKRKDDDHSSRKSTEDGNEREISKISEKRKDDENSWGKSTFDENDKESINRSEKRKDDEHSNRKSIVEEKEKSKRIEKWKDDEHSPRRSRNDDDERNKRRHTSRSDSESISGEGERKKDHGAPKSTVSSRLLALSSQSGSGPRGKLLDELHENYIVQNKINKENHEPTDDEIKKQIFLPSKDKVAEFKEPLTMWQTVEKSGIPSWRKELLPEEEIVHPEDWKPPTPPKVDLSLESYTSSFDKEKPKPPKINEILTDKEDVLRQDLLSDRSACSGFSTKQTNNSNSCHDNSLTASTVMRYVINLSEMKVSTDYLTFTAVFSHITIDGVVWVTPDDHDLGSSIPLKLYGLKKIKSSHNPEDLSKLWLAPGTEVNVVIIYTIEDGPLPAKVRYTKVKKYDGNLALEWISTGLYEVLTSARDWTRELHDHNISTSFFHLIPLVCPIPLVLPHPLPLAVNQWYHVTIEAVEYPLDTNFVETEPNLSTPHANRVGVHMVSLNIDLLHQTMINGQVDKIMSSFSNAQEEFKNSASVGFQLLKVDKEKIFLAPYQGSEWCRVNIHQDVGDGTVIVFFIDYGHWGRARLEDLRAVLNRELEMQPSQLVQVNFSLPDTESELDFKRRKLEETSVSLVMKVEHIYESDIVEVSFWELEQGEKLSWFRKIC